MKCPVCKDVTLLMSEKKGVEIDYCPECRGIGLDRGELDKLLEKEENYNKDTYENKSYKEDYKHYEDDKYKPRKKKRESFLGEIFDMFGD